MRDESQHYHYQAAALNRGVRRAVIRREQQALCRALDNACARQPGRRLRGWLDFYQILHRLVDLSMREDYR